MTDELYWLTLSLIATALMAFPYVIERFVVRGLLGAIANHTPEIGEGQSLWAKRAMSAHRNMVENLVVFAPAVLMLAMLSLSTPATRLAAPLFFFARIGHYFSYALGIPFARTLLFAAGLVAQLLILFAILLR